MIGKGFWMLLRKGRFSIMKQSNRTKNRLREHNIMFDFDKRCFDIIGFEGRDMVHGVCIDEGCEWFGWLPVDEVDRLTIEEYNNVCNHSD